MALPLTSGGSLASVQTQAGIVYGSLFPNKQVAGLLGQYYTVAQVAGMAAVTSLVALTEASPFFIIENTAGVGGPNIALDFVRLQATAIAAAGTDMQYTWKTDTVRGKWSSAGTAFTPQNVNQNYPNVSAASVHAGALVVATAGQSSANARVVGAGYLNNVATAPAQIIGDLYDFRFGANEAPLPTVVSNVASAGAHTFPVALCVPLGPVVLPPGSTATLFLWGTLNASAPSYNLVAGWYEF